MTAKQKQLIERLLRCRDPIRPSSRTMSTFPMRKNHTQASNGGPPHVVVVGGGSGGLAAVRKLSRERVRVTVIDRRNYHLFQPLLYQVATATLSPADIASAIRHVLRGCLNV